MTLISIKERKKNMDKIKNKFYALNKYPYKRTHKKFNESRYNEYKSHLDMIWFHYCCIHKIKKRFGDNHHTLPKHYQLLIENIDYFLFDIRLPSLE